MVAHGIGGGRTTDASNAPDAPVRRGGRGQCSETLRWLGKVFCSAGTSVRGETSARLTGTWAGRLISTNSSWSVAEVLEDHPNCPRTPSLTPGAGTRNAGVLPGSDDARAVPARARFV